MYVIACNLALLSRIGCQKMTTGIFWSEKYLDRVFLVFESGNSIYPASKQCSFCGNISIAMVDDLRPGTSWLYNQSPSSVLQAPEVNPRSCDAGWLMKPASTWLPTGENAEISTRGKLYSRHNATKHLCSSLFCAKERKTETPPPLNWWSNLSVITSRWIPTWHAKKKPHRRNKKW